MSNVEKPEIDDNEELILSAYVATSDELFPRILDLHVESGSKVADVTFGRGIFWQEVDLNDRGLELRGSDIDPQKSPCGESVDCRDLPYEDNSFDVVILDPPYAEGFYRRNEEHLAGNGSHSRFRDAYSSGELYEGEPKWHRAVLDMYVRAGSEARRILREDGTLITKVGDEVSSNTQELTHYQIIRVYEDEFDFYTKDLFVQVRSERPHSSGMNKQVHARKNHSFYLVFKN